MIKFYRIIRQNILMENKTGKYIKYAFGEIVLVVIGILIAVQINGYYKKQAEMQINIQLLNRMISEIDLNIERLDFLEYNTNLDSLRTKVFSENEKELKWSLTILENGVKTQDIDSLVLVDFNRSSYNLHRSIYDKMINTGKLYNLGSDSLIGEINEYYKLIEREDYYNKKQIIRTNDLYFQCKYGWVNLVNDYRLKSGVNLADYPWLSDKTSKEYVNLRTYWSKAHAVIKRSRERMDGIRMRSYKLKEHIQLAIND
ncbi:hypothetical protein [Hanstruepera marina]|uniref:hypothetical protein n=1 Tax=Hanstruepera marina TaxID=2873265 RepID=UPI001CA663D8|nr:hypothetical protein [Hanstruepera marina]